MPHSCQLCIHNELSLMLLCSSTKKTYVYRHKETFLFAIHSQKISFMSTDAQYISILLLSYERESERLLLLPWLPFRETLPQWLSQYLSSAPMGGTALPGGSRDFTNFWAAAQDNVALMPASCSATRQPRNPETLNMGHELNPLHRFCSEICRKTSLTLQSVGTGTYNHISGHEWVVQK